MSTRSIIAVQMDDGSIKTTYCHFDEYINGVGAALFNRIKTQAEAVKLIEGGKLRGFDRDGPEYYNDGSEHLSFNNFEDYSNHIFDCIDYFYLFTNDGWFVCKSHKDFSQFVPIASVFNKAN